MKQFVARRIVVISDLHVGSGPLDDCDQSVESKLVEFLRYLSNVSPAELVINGDFLDFAQATPWFGDELRSRSPDGVPLCFTEQQSVTKADSIYNAHPAIFQALDSFLGADSNNLIVILPGNHDADFFWPGVQDYLQAKLSRASRSSGYLCFHLNQVYRPPNRPSVWIEHGHQYDPCNLFSIGGKAFWQDGSPPIFKDTYGQERLLECVGTRFLLKFLNRLDADYPFVDNVKPFSRFLRIFGASALQPGAAPLKAAVALWSMMKFLGQAVVHQPLDLLSHAGLAGPSSYDKPGLLFSGLSESQRSRLQEALTQAGFILDRPLNMFVANVDSAESLIDFLADHMEILDQLQKTQHSLLGVEGRAGTLTLAKGFTVDETKELVKMATKILSSNSVEFVIMGHTHEAVEPSSQLAYINTGSWTRNLDFGRGETPSSWSLLRADATELFPYELNFADIPADHPFRIELRNFHKQAHFSDSAEKPS
jgi:UDP-2,3-diacylglucosamine pyrophosphatase LpxH